MKWSSLSFNFSTVFVIIDINRRGNKKLTERIQDCLSYDIIKAHSGEIKMVTREGEVAEFIVQLPV